MAQIEHRLRIEREQLAVGERFHRSGARRSIQDRQLAEEIAFTIKRQILLPAVHANECARSALLEHVHWPGRFALANNQVAFGRADRCQPLDYGPQCRRGQAAEVAELIEETLHRAVASRHLDVVAQLRHLLHEIEKIVAIDSHNLHRGRAANGRVAGPAIEQRSLAETIAGLEHSQRDLFAVALDLERTRAAFCQDVKRVRWIALLHDHIAEVVTFFLQ